MKVKIERIVELDNCYKVTASFECKGKVFRETFSFLHECFESEKYKKIFKKWAENVKRTTKPAVKEGDVLVL